MSCNVNRRVRHLVQVVVALALATLHGSSPVSAGEWPQILGPTRNGVAVDEQIVSKLPKGGPAILWEHPVGEGYGGPAVAGGVVVVFHRPGSEELAEGLNPQTGAPLWTTPFPANYAGGINADRGPRCVPVIHDGSVYLLDAAGDLHGIELQTGKERWSRTTGADFKVPESYFGAGSTPIVVGDKLLVNVGGRPNAGIVAFALSDGATVWKATDEGASYSSPTTATIGGVRHVIFVTRLSALSIDPDNGNVRWKFRFGAPGPTVNAATPLVVDGNLFLSASYGIGAVCRKIGASDTQEIWADNDTMSSQFSTCVPHGGFLYGVDGRQDGAPGRLRCFDPRTGKVKWTQERFGIASLILADAKLVILTDDGSLVLAEPSPEAYRELGRAKISKSTTRALPALANGLLYLRDSTTLKCVDLRRKR